LFTFQRINVVCADAAPVELKILLLRDYGQVKRHRAELSDDSIMPESNFIFSRPSMLPVKLVLKAGRTTIQDFDCSVTETQEIADLPGPFREFRVQEIAINIVLRGDNVSHHNRPISLEIARPPS